MRKIAVLTSGGDSPGMNTCVRAVVRYAISQGLEVYAIKRGFAGLVDGEMEKMTERSVGNIIQYGGTILKTARCQAFKNSEVQDMVAEKFKTLGIEGLVVIGGDGTFKGANELIKRGIMCACIPATIDNNLAYTDFTIGFDTATNTVIDMINKVRDTSMSHDRVSIVETMGAGCGDLALKAGLAAGADIVVVPEVPYSIDKICEKLTKARANNKRFSIVVVSEHIFNGTELAKIITEKCGVECRCSVFGHVQRGGSPTAFDRNLATHYGVRAVQELMKNNCGVVGYKHGEYIYITIDEALSAKAEFDMEEYELVEKLSF